VVWISRYAAGNNLFLDLEVVEELTTNPGTAFERLVDMLPVTFRCEWGAWVGPGDQVLHGTEGAPTAIPYVALDKPARLDSVDGEDLVCAAPLTGKEIVVLGRRGGPEFLESELARLGHLAGLAASIADRG
jgi:hypothetical protein